jgi:hypothetical protein
VISGGQGKAVLNSELVTDHLSLITPDMLDLGTVTHEQFTPCLDQDFEIVFSDGTLPLKLTEARPLGVRPESIREPFALTFLGRAGLRLPQGIYKMRNASLGEMEIFLVQLAADQTGSTFEAVFN